MHTCTLSLSLSLCNTHTHTHTQPSLSLSHTNQNTHRTERTQGKEHKRFEPIPDLVGSRCLCRLVGVIHSLQGFQHLFHITQHSYCTAHATHFITCSPSHNTTLSLHCPCHSLHHTFIFTQADSLGPFTLVNISGQSSGLTQDAVITPGHPETDASCACFRSTVGLSNDRIPSRLIWCHSGSSKTLTSASRRFVSITTDGWCVGSNVDTWNFWLTPGPHCKYKSSSTSTSWAKPGQVQGWPQMGPESAAHIHNHSLSAASLKTADHFPENCQRLLEAC